MDTVYAARNLVHPVESADVAHVVAGELAHRVATPPHTVHLHVEDLVSWVWPNRWTAGHRPAYLDLRTNAGTTARTLQLVREGHILAKHRVSHGTPNRSLRVPSGFLYAVGGGDATVRQR
ncbi:MAG TPA: hypothetical protein VIJ86_10090 [Acidimicrobiales bacterium]